jgi:PAT family beta-lactamase induction signal transducer AmpG
MKDEIIQNAPAAAVTANPPDAVVVGPLNYEIQPAIPSASWIFIPVLYVMQAMPVTTVQEMFPVAFKDLGLPNPLIIAWTSIIALPWTLKLFWAPLVDLNSTKRRWTLTLEVLIALSFAVLAACVLLPQYSGDKQQFGFVITLVMLLAIAVFSSTHDIACDGLYMLSLSRQRQAAYVGLQGSCYKLGRLLCVGGLVWLAGEWIHLGHSTVQSWMSVLLVAVVLYGLGTIFNFFMLPKPATDRPAVESQPGENRRDILRTVLVLILGVGIYLLIYSGLVLIGGFTFDLVNSSRITPVLTPWRQSNADMRYWAVVLVIGLIIFVIAAVMIRRALSGTAMATAFVTFVRQDRFWAIMAFIMFYRFGEAMVTRVLPLFLKDPITVGGLGVSTRDVGGIVGLSGVLGIICGGIVGGILVARLGLRRSFWPLAIAMYAPNIFYLFIAISYRQFADPHAWPNALFHNWVLYLAAYIHEFGYGIGFATYSLFLMNIAQRGNFKTAHYAFGTGLGALCIVAAGIVSAILLTIVSYVWFFVAVCLLTVPGMLTLLIIPMDPAND